MTQADTAELTRNKAFIEAIDVVIAQALFTLTPFFMDGAKGDPAKALAGAREMLHAYQAASAVEIQLAVECIIFSYSSVDCLHQARTTPDLPEPKRLRLRNCAVALNRAGHRNRLALDACRRARAPSPDEAAEAAAPPASNAAAEQMSMACDFLQKLNRGGEMPPELANLATPQRFMNREQRRAAELEARRQARRSQG